MLKKILIIFAFISIIFSNSAKAEVFEYVGTEFDWNVLNQQEKTERVSNIFKLMFPTGEITNYTKKEFKQTFKNYLKDTNTNIHYDAMVAGYKEYKKVKLEPYFYKDTDCIYMYALQYKNDLTKTYYYSVLGKLQFVDLRYGDLENYPCYIKKYGKNGKFKRAVYLPNPDTVYMYNGKGVFEGVQYKGEVVK